MIRRATTRAAVVVTASCTLLTTAASPTAASAIPGQSYCNDSKSPSGTQRASVCVYFEWGNYKNGFPWGYHVVGNIVGYSGIGSSKLTIIRVGKQKCHYVVGGGCNWQDAGTTAPSQRITRTGSVRLQTVDYSRPYGGEGCETIRAVNSWRIDFSSGGYRTGFFYTPPWGRSCI